MDALNFDLLLRILVAHFLADFIFQPSSWVKKKSEHGLKSGYFWLHIAIHLVTLSVMLWDWHLLPVIIWVTLSCQHGLEPYKRCAVTKPLSRNLAHPIPQLRRALKHGRREGFRGRNPR